MRPIAEVSTEFSYESPARSILCSTTYQAVPVPPQLSGTRERHSRHDSQARFHGCNNCRPYRGRSRPWRLHHHVPRIESIHTHTSTASVVHSVRPEGVDEMLAWNLPRSSCCRLTCRATPQYLGSSCLRPDQRVPGVEQHSLSNMDLSPIHTPLRLSDRITSNPTTPPLSRNEIARWCERSLGYGDPRQGNRI